MLELKLYLFMGSVCTQGKGVRQKPMFVHEDMVVKSILIFKTFDLKGGRLLRC